MKRLLLVVVIIVCAIGWPFARDAFRFSKVASALKRAENVEASKHQLRRLLYMHGADRVSFIDRAGLMIDPTDAHDQPAQVFKMKITIRYTGQRIDVVHVDREMVGAVLGCKM